MRHLFTPERVDPILLAILVVVVVIVAFINFSP